ncbi:glycosyltransferase [Spirosoma knui]
MKSNVKVFVDAHVFDGEYQGTRTYIRELYRRLATYAGIDLYLASYETENLKKDFQQGENVHFLQYSTPKRTRRLAVNINQLICKHQINVAHFQYVVPPIKTCKYIVTTHDILFKDFPTEFPLAYRLSKGLLYQLSARMADVVTTVSDYSKSAISRHFSIPDEKIHVVPNGVSEHFFDDYGRQVCQAQIASRYGVNNYILYVSRIEPRKRQASLLKAYLDAQLYEKGIQLVFIGHQSLSVPELDGVYENLPEKVKQSIHFLHGVNDQDLLTFYRAAQLFVYPSVAEGFGIPPLEAGAMRVPTLCSNTTAMSDFSFFGEQHFYPSTENIKEHLIRFFTSSRRSSDELNQIADAVRQKYSWDQSARILYNLIQSLN